MAKRLGFVVTVVSLLQPSTATARADPFEYSWQELAPGVWAGIRHDPFELPQEGNSVFVVTDEGVVTFDAGGSPLMGESIVAKVRAVTDKPITHVVLSHWHGDHMRGLQAIRAAFPNVRVLAHPHSRERIASTQDRWLKRRVTMVPNIRKAVADALGKGQDLSARPLVDEEREWLQRGLAVADQLDLENQRTAYVVPDVTFEERLILYIGGREIQFLHLGRAHTAGDIVLWLPQERLVATGDVVTGPIPLMPSAYTGEYVGVLERIEALGFQTLVPGHGPVEHDTRYVDLLIDTFRLATTQMASLVAQGLGEEDATARLDLSVVRQRFTHGDSFLEHRFQDYVAREALPHAAYAAATGKDPDEAF
jgi:glyoxylase-like metal-dependent hydrolase (beta-lactamase superfamily II)